MESSPLQALLSVPTDKRDADWEREFLKFFPEARLFILSPDPKPGPDGWPYLLVSTGETAQEPALKVIDWLSTRGIGLVINPQNEAPDYVFSYGMLWNFKERGSFLTDAPIRPPGEIKLKSGDEVLTGTPSESYLPSYARSILKQFLADQAVYAPRVLLVSADQKNYDLCFSTESLGNPPEHEHAGIAEAISWFLPAHYSVALISEKVVPGFQSL